MLGTRRHLLALLFCLECVLPAISARAEEFCVVVNAGNPVASLTRQQVSDYFLKKSVTWQDGRKVLPVDLDADSPARAAFSHALLGRSVAAVKSYWNQRIFSGRGVPPPEQPSQKAVLDYVRANAGAIGYVSAAHPPADVKAVKIVE